MAFGEQRHSAGTPQGYILTRVYVPLPINSQRPAPFSMQISSKPQMMLIEYFSAPNYNQRGTEQRRCFIDAAAQVEICRVQGNRHPNPLPLSNLEEHLRNTHTDTIRNFSIYWTGPRGCSNPAPSGAALPPPRPSAPSPQKMAAAPPSPHANGSQPYCDAPAGTTVTRSSAPPPRGPSANHNRALPPSLLRRASRLAESRSSPAPLC